MLTANKNVIAIKGFILYNLDLGQKAALKDLEDYMQP